MKTPPPNPLPEAERGSKTTTSPRCGKQEQDHASPVLLPLSASGRGLGGGVLEPVPKLTPHNVTMPVAALSGRRPQSRPCGPGPPRCAPATDRACRLVCSRRRGESARNRRRPPPSDLPAAGRGDCAAAGGR